MFTVIFADEETIQFFEETKMFFEPLFCADQIAFCKWDTNAETFDSMVPGLYELIEFQNEWRAVVLSNASAQKLNPFHYTMYHEPYFSEDKRDWAYYKSRRANRIRAYEKAVSNPLVKLTTALCELPKLKSVISDPAVYEALLTGQMEVYEYMLASQLRVLKCKELAARFEKYQRDSLKRFVQDEKIDDLIACIKEADVSGIIHMVPDTEILEFIRLIGDDPIYYDPEYTECLIENTKKEALLNSIAANFSFRDKLPAEVICLATRTADLKKFEQDVQWMKKDENSYSRFADFNLYNESLKFVLFDVRPRENRQYRFDQIKLICLLLMLAKNELPQGVVRAGYVYRADVDFDVNSIAEICGKYIGKLKKTETYLKDIETQLVYESDTSVDDRTAERLFESNIHIPVKISQENKKTELYAQYNTIGLSTDCPEDEKGYWSKQYREIHKRFIRYLREPRRAVKTAVEEGLHKNNLISDDRATLLNEKQMEDVTYHLLGEEQTMVSTVTSRLFDTASYTQQIQEADENIKKGIRQRMSRRKTVISSLIAVAAYLIGFLPLLFTSLNSVASFTFSAGIIGVMIGLFILVGFLYLFILRRRLINRFKHFNYVMSKICREITKALSQFSTYLSCVCNIMRDYSVLHYTESTLSQNKKVLAYHDVRIQNQIKRVCEIFSQYVDLKQISFKECEPYDFDFLILHDYKFELPGLNSPRKIEFLQSGNEITVPVDYIKAITMKREELYD